MCCLHLNIVWLSRATNSFTTHCRGGHYISLSNECVNVFYYINSANSLCNTNFQPRLTGQCLFSPLDTQQRMCPYPITSCIAQSPIRQDADYTHDLLTMLSCRLAFNNLNGKIKYLTLTERSKVSG